MIAPSEVFNYELPEERIAQRPVYPYSSAKFLVADKNTSSIQDSSFDSIVDFLKPSDLLLFNNTRVRASRLFGKLQSGAAVELLVLREFDQGKFECMGKPLKKLTPGTQVEIEGGLLAEAGERIADTKIEMKLKLGDRLATLEDVDKAAVMPIPPYIRKGRADEKDRADYQTHFAELTGSVAAPTASLHFTPELTEKIKELGCSIEFLTLHVGPPSFLSLWQEGDQAIEGPGREMYVSDPKLIKRCQKVKEAGGRVVAVGTTVVRAIESMARQSKAGIFETDLFISPGFEFAIVDAMVTNFHLPRSSHLLLVEAFMGRELLADTYKHALANNYRFLSYGDGMLIT